MAVRQPRGGTAAYLNGPQLQRFFREIGKVLSKRSLMMIKSILPRSIRCAQKHDFIGKNVTELVDLPEGQPVARHGQ